MSLSKLEERSEVAEFARLVGAGVEFNDGRLINAVDLDYSFGSSTLSVPWYKKMLKGVIDLLKIPSVRDSILRCRLVKLGELVQITRVRYMVLWQEASNELENFCKEIVDAIESTLRQILPLSESEPSVQTGMTSLWCFATVLSRDPLFEILARNDAVMFVSDRVGKSLVELKKGLLRQANDTAWDVIIELGDSEVSEHTHEEAIACLLVIATCCYLDGDSYETLRALDRLDLLEGGMTMHTNIRRAFVLHYLMGETNDALKLLEKTLPEHPVDEKVLLYVDGLKLQLLASSSRLFEHRLITESYRFLKKNVNVVDCPAGFILSLGAITSLKTLTLDINSEKLFTNYYEKLLFEKIRLSFYKGELDDVQLLKLYGNLMSVFPHDRIHFKEIMDKIDECVMVNKGIRDYAEFVKVSLVLKTYPDYELKHEKETLLHLYDSENASAVACSMLETAKIELQAGMHQTNCFGMMSRAYHKAVQFPEILKQIAEQLAESLCDPIPWLVREYKNEEVEH